MKHTTFEKSEDFLLDDRFCNWMNSNKKNHNEYWTDWLDVNEDKEEMFNDAKELFQLLQLNKQSIPEEDIEQELSFLEQKINTNHNLQIAHKRQREQKLLLLRSLAAMFLLLATGWLAYFYLFSTTTYQTAFGEKQEVILPDNSKVILQANSSLEIKKEWNKDGLREVWLTGEAFFEVEKAASAKNRFIVHTDKLNVEVLGTKFDVLNRNKRTFVVLNEGKVKVNFNQQQSLIDNRKDSSKSTKTKGSNLSPGEMITYHSSKKSFIKQSVNPDNYSSWTYGKLKFNDVPLKELGILLKDVYGVELRFKDKSLSQKRIKGTIPSENIDVLLGAVEQIFNVKVTKKENIITLE